MKRTMILLVLLLLTSACTTMRPGEKLYVGRVRCQENPMVFFNYYATAMDEDEARQIIGRRVKNTPSFSPIYDCAVEEFYQVK